MKILAIGAHQDDNEFRVGGMASKWVKAGHEVCFLSLCNGSGGHHIMTPKETTARRATESAAVAEYLGIRYDVWDIEDCELVADLATRNRLIRYIREFSPDRLICLFGSVGGRTRGRRAELGKTAAALADFCILTSDNPDSEPPEKIIDDIAECFREDGACPFIRIPDRREAIRFAVANAKNGDVILLAGKGHEDYQLINGKKIPFSERSIIEESLLELAEV